MWRFVKYSRTRPQVDKVIIPFAQLFAQIFCMLLGCYATRVTLMNIAQIY